MQIKNTIVRYGAVAQLFHWVIVVLIITQFALAWRADSLPLGLAKLSTLARHKSFGMTVLALATLRLVWRFLNPSPRLPANVQTWQRWAAHLTHWLLYALLFAVPLMGWLMSSAKNYTVSWFNLFTFPNLVQPSETLFKFFRDTHEFLAISLLVVAVVHVLAALKHHFMDKDDVLRHMLPVRSRNET